MTPGVIWRKNCILIFVREGECVWLCPPKIAPPASALKHILTLKLHHVIQFVFTLYYLSKRWHSKPRNYQMGSDGKKSTSYQWNCHLNNVSLLCLICASRKQVSFLCLCGGVYPWPPQEVLLAIWLQSVLIASWMQLHLCVCVWSTIWLQSNAS